MTEEVIAIITVFIAFLALAILAPFLTIWSLNELFSLNINYNLKTWLAASWLLIVIYSIRLHVQKSQQL